MKTNNSKTKAKAFLGAAFMLLIALIFTACPQKAKPKAEEPPVPPKHAITFNVDGANGKLTAKVDGGDIASGNEVEEGKTVTFTATANAGYRVKGWTLDGKPITEAGTNTEYKLKVSKPATVKVSFEAIPPTKYTVTLTQTEHGKVTASPEIPEDKQVAEDTEITFTAKADDGYKVDKWTVTPAEALQAGGADESLTAKVKITADTTVSVSFIKKTYAVNFSVAGTGGTLKAEGDGITQPATSPITVEHGKEVTFTATADDGYRVKGWTLDGNAVNGTAETYTLLAVTQPATVKVSFELIPEVAILTLDPNKLTIEVRAVTEDGSAIEVEGCTETTLANDTETKLTAKGTKVILKGKITELYCNGNHSNNQSLTSLNVQGLTALQKLNCSYNQLTALNVQGLTALQELSCSGNQLPELNVQGLTALQTLDCSVNQLPELNVQGCASLQLLDCSNNQLTALNVQGCTALQKFGCFGNKLNAQAMTELLNALPAREESDDAFAILYAEVTGFTEGNYKDFTQPEDLKKAVEDAKSKEWKLRKMNASGSPEDL